MATTVKYGDTHDLTWTVNTDLTGATVTGHLRLRRYGEEWQDITMDVTESSATESTVRHSLTGTLPVGDYDLLVQASTPGRRATVPTMGVQLLVVEPNAD